MPTVTIVGNVCFLTLGTPIGQLTIDMSLQRHHYRYCAQGVAAALNSMMYANLTEDQVIADINELGSKLEELSKKSGFNPTKWFGKEFTVPSKRIYLVDNTILNPNGYPNHFFVTQGPSVWEKMNQNEWLAAQAIRRIEEAINQKIQRGDTKNYLDQKTIGRDIAANPGGGGNPVLICYISARTALRMPSINYSNFKECSNQSKIVDIVQFL